MFYINVPYLASFNNNTHLQELSNALDSMEPNTLQISPWHTPQNKPDVSFVVAHAGDCILLKYYVLERSIRGFHSQSNTPVHEDSCVEFFISFDGDDEYYNLEFNCIGTCLFGFGKDKGNRLLMPEDAIGKIRRLVVIEPLVKGNDNLVYWELVVSIPLEVFTHYNISNLKEKTCQVNFFKCGDHLPEPHFLTWNNIVAASPDFHLPQYFGRLHFA
jgi:hypothetical protein